MNLADLATWASALDIYVGVALEESRRQQDAITLRTAYVSRETGMLPQDAQRVALFTLGKWAERYPDRPDDLGGDASVFLAQWCLSRGVEPSDNVLHDALPVWRAYDTVGPPRRHEKVALPAVATLAQSCMQKLFETARRARNKRKAERRRRRKP